jgi:hypothetical protein
VRDPINENEVDSLTINPKQKERASQQYNPNDKKNSANIRTNTGFGPKEPNMSLYYQQY